MQQATLIDLPDPEWMDVLRAEAEKPNTTKQAIADALGVSRTAISLLIAGKYTARTDKVTRKIADKVMELYAHRRWCPHLHRSITPTACAEHRSMPMPMSDPVALRHWVACKNCPQNPASKKDQTDAV
ncbi:helix-turn-helix domain-containing protein [Rhizobium herbae]|uniref:DNA-binding XRE family transcriptional regulator n=1 Tax=Rhizobium herbae TaxID=508661 RepID=A0ABS4EW31_9HYPH|nr:helix-turn-helix transcriptional regulator [Rhizobium herbae]MBP1862168.1 DNA-binding XRE family transcriptional regulator [Rhizobium herbae]